MSQTSDPQGSSSTCNWQKVGLSPSWPAPAEVPELHIPKVLEGNFRFREFSPQVLGPPWQPGAGLPKPVARHCSVTDGPQATGPGPPGGSAQVPAPHSQSRKAAGIHESAAATQVPAQTFPGEVPALTSALSGPLPALLRMRTRRLPLPGRTVSPRMLYAPAQAPPCPSPYPRLCFHPPPRSPGVALFPTIWLHSRTPLPAVPATDPGVRAPADVRKLLRGQRTAAPPSQRRMPPTTFPSILSGLSRD